MDIISGIVVSTAAFMLSMALVVLFTRLPNAGIERSLEIEGRNLARKFMVTSLVVYFVAVVNLLLIAQQVSLALGTFVIGGVLLVVYYVEPGLRGRGEQGPGDSESWGR